MSMAESILPGVYFEEVVVSRVAEALGDINTVGLIGTATKGPVNEVVTISSYNEAVAIFGAPEQLDGNTNSDKARMLSLYLKLLHAYPGVTVNAIRTANISGTNQYEQAIYKLECLTNAVELHSHDQEDDVELYGTWYNGGQTGTGDITESQIVFSDADEEAACGKAYQWDASEVGTESTEITTNINTPDTDSTMFPAAPAAGDAFLVGHETRQFNSFRLKMATAAIGYVDLAIQYYDSVLSDWVTMDQTHGLIDGTLKLTRDGIISFNKPSTWGTTTEGAQVADGYYIRLLVTTAGSQHPTEDQGWLNGTLADMTITITDVDGSQYIESFRAMDPAFATFINIINGDDTTYDYENNSSTWNGIDGKSRIFKAEQSSPAPTGDVDVTAAPEIQQLGVDGHLDAFGNKWANFVTASKLLRNNDAHLIIFAGLTKDEAILTGILDDTVGASGESRERFCFVGNELGQSVEDIVTDADQASERLCHVAGDVEIADPITLKPIRVGGHVALANLVGWIASRPSNLNAMNKPLLGIVDVNTNATVGKEYTRGDREKLRKANLSVIIKKPYVTFEDVITTSADPYWRDVQVRREVDYIRYQIRNVMQPYIGENNNVGNRDAILASGESVMSVAQSGGWIQAGWRVTVTADLTARQQGKVYVDFEFEPTRAIKKIMIRFYLS